MLNPAAEIQLPLATCNRATTIRLLLAIGPTKAIELVGYAQYN